MYFQTVIKNEIETFRLKFYFFNFKDKLKKCTLCQNLNENVKLVVAFVFHPKQTKNVIAVCFWKKHLSTSSMCHIFS